MIGDIAEYLGWNQMFKEYISIYILLVQNQKYVYIVGSKSEKKS